MGLLSATRNAWAGLWTRFGGWGLSRMRFLLPGSRFDYEREAGDLWSNSVVAIGLKWTGDRLAKPLIRVSKIDSDGDYEPIGQHPLADLWQRPNTFYGRRTLEKAVGLSLFVDGNAYLYKARARGNKVVELWWIPHFRIQPTWPDDGSTFINGYKLQVDGQYFTLPPEDVVHVRDGIDPRNERLGLSALKGQFREVCTINEESGFTASLLRNSGVPGLMIVPLDERLRPDEDDADRIKKRIKDTTGGENRGEAVVLGGRYQVTQVGFSPEQLRLDRLPLNAISRVTASMGLAAMSLGLPDPGKTYSNLAEANKASWGTITACHDLVAEAIRWQLLPDFDDPATTVFEYVYDHISELQEDAQAKSTRVVAEYAGGVRKRSEAREELGLDTEPEDDVYFVEPSGGSDMNSGFDGNSVNGVFGLASEVLHDVKAQLAARHDHTGHHGNGSGNGHAARFTLPGIEG